MLGLRSVCKPAASGSGSVVVESSGVGERESVVLGWVGGEAMISS
jgi:hypothetical protein